MTLEITPAGATPTRRADPAYFTGEVWQEPVITTPGDAPVGVLRVWFGPGGRTNWHTHPGGQTLHVLWGDGWVQVRGEPARAIRPGDTVWIPPGVEHWHGAGPGRAMLHIAMQHIVDGSPVAWLDPVSEADYTAATDQS